jgi:alpha-glucuronidase
VSVDYSSPMSLGGLDTADPLDKGVVKFWRDQADAIYSVIPDFGGFVVKADSENRPGPFTYDRNHAEGANVLAQALQRHNGTVIWRCFVYNCHQDWRDRSTDRARAAYDTFMELDGQFMDNVLLQVKNGPVDFQVREPVSPLIGGLEKTNVIVEFQITQEYTGQQHDLCYLIPQWKEVLDFDTHAAGDESLAWKVAAGQVFPMAISGIAAVVNVGDDQNWTGHHLAQANLYGYGRLTWNPALEADTITDEWVRLTFGSEPEVLRVVSSLLSESWSVYEQYTAPLGIGWMCNPGYHYGPSPDGYEYSMWGTYHFADHEGIGVDRTLATGSGYAGQYRAPNTALYESLDTCPDELLLFFHHVPYTHRLRSGQTVLQHIYDTHFSGVESARRMREEWQSLAGKIDGRRHKEVLQRFDEQVANAELWRDVVNTYFYRKSGVPDVENRHIYK